MDIQSFFYLVKKTSEDLGIYVLIIKGFTIF